ncbi:hypothetical protein DFP73DRAFT_556824 [Morchella snyderi]|nr:hypothetical protein DFP73DRAFT_556824 [Morchella snyderi]
MDVCEVDQLCLLLFSFFFSSFFLLRFGNCLVRKSFIIIADSVFPFFLSSFLLLGSFLFLYFRN